MLKRLVRKFRKQEEGAAIVEYGLLVALIALACIFALTTLGKNLGNMFNGVANTVKNVPTNAR
jgi:pilus assembly protein Flp/PilA